MSTTEMPLATVIGETGLIADGDWVESKDQDPNGDVRLIQLADVGDGEYINKSNRFLTSEKAAQLRCTFLKPGDVLVSRMADPIGRACTFPGDAKPCVAVVDICVVRPDHDVANAEWLKYAINSRRFRSVVESRAVGATRPRISGKNLRALPIDIPPLPEQRRIVDLLSRAEGIVRLRREAEKKAAELIPALFLDMFGDPAGNPKGWATEEFGKVISYSRYGPRFPNREYAESGAHILRTTDMSEDGYLRWWESPVMAVSPEEIAKYQLTPRTLLITRTGTIGRVAMFMGAADPCIAGAYLLEFGLKDVIDPDYALAFFLSAYGQQCLIRGSRSVAQPNINAPTVMAITIPIPPMDKQLGFAKKVEEVRSIQSQQSTATAKAQAAFDALLSQVFSVNEAPA